MNEFEHLKIQLEEIKKATGSFSDSSIIGRGGFGNVYKGEVSHFKGRSMVAIKRLDSKFGQGVPEFLKEIAMLSRYTHKNLISLFGFCDEDGEKILVYEHASNGSLDGHLSSTSLTWAQRIKICLDAAKGLSYLHDHKGSQQRVLHRDIKSANILLDQDWNAIVSDMGLSRLAPANQMHTLVFTNVVGTGPYCDPEYMMKFTLTKESDIYSFGVVLFEVMCGRLCFKVDSNRQVLILVPTWKESYKQEKLEEIIFKELTPPMDKTSLKTFADIAFQCVQESREHRPKISLVMKELETALKCQECYEMNLLKKYHDEEIIKDVETLSNYTYLEDQTSRGEKVLFILDQSEGAKQKDFEGVRWWVVVTLAPVFTLVAMFWMLSVLVKDFNQFMTTGDIGGGWRRRLLLIFAVLGWVAHGWWQWWWAEMVKAAVVGMMTVIVVGLVLFGIIPSN